MAKYIVEVKGGETLYKAVIAPDGEPYITPAMGNVYTEPDLEQVRCAAYEEGRNSLLIEVQKAGKNTIKLEEDEYYQRGLSDAWEAARKIGNMPYVEEERAFGSGGWKFIEKHTASEAIEKIRQYEQKQEEIKVGDEVKNTQTGVKFIVTHLWKNNRGEQGVSGFNQECSAFSTTLSLVVKTGRHFSEIAAILEKMREGQDGERREE